MATTIPPTLTASELRSGLQELLELIEQVAALDARIESKALDLSCSDWGEDFENRQYVNALSGQLKGVFGDVADRADDEWNPLDVADEIQVALKLVELAGERSGDA